MTSRPGRLETHQKSSSGLREKCDVMNICWESSDDSHLIDHTAHSRDNTGMIHQPVSILKKTGDKELKKERKAVIIVNDEMVNTLDKEPDGLNHKEENSMASETLEPLTSI